MTDRKKRSKSDRAGPGVSIAREAIASGEPVVYGREGRIATGSGQPSGRPAAADVVSRAEFNALGEAALRLGTALERLAERVEDLEDALAAQATRATAKPEDALSADLVNRLIAGESPVRIWREHRGLTLTALAERAEVPQGYLSEIEHRKKPGSLRAMRALARALDLDLDDLVRDPAELRE